MKKYIVIIFFLSNYKLSLGQSDMKDIIITFPTNSYIISENEYVHLDSIVSQLIRIKELSIFHISLVNYSSKIEMKQMYSIGALRAIEIINYVEKKYKFNREKFYYVDSYLSHDDSPLIKIDETGIIFRLVR